MSDKTSKSQEPTNNQAESNEQQKIIEPTNNQAESNKQQEIIGPTISQAELNKQQEIIEPTISQAESNQQQKIEKPIRKSQRKRGVTLHTNYISLGGEPISIELLGAQAEKIDDHTKIPTKNLPDTMGRCKRCNRDLQLKGDGTVYCLCTYEDALKRGKIHYDENTQISVENYESQRNLDQNDQVQSIAATESVASVTERTRRESEDNLQQNSQTDTQESEGSIFGNDGISNKDAEFENSNQNNRYRTQQTPKRNGFEFDKTTSADIEHLQQMRTQVEPTRENADRSSIAPDTRFRINRMREQERDKYTPKHSQYEQNQERMEKLAASISEQNSLQWKRNQEHMEQQDLKIDQLSDILIRWFPNENQGQGMNRGRESFINRKEDRVRYPTPTSLATHTENNQTGNETLINMVANDQEDQCTGQDKDINGGRSIRVSGPKKFKGDGESINEFERDYRHYVKWEGVDDRKAAQLIRFSLEGDAREYYDSMAQDDKRDLETIFTRMKSRFCPSSFRLIIHERLCSERMSEQESINDYISRFNKMTQIIELSDSQKVAQFTAGLTGSLKEHVILANPNTLVAAFEAARVKDSAGKHNTSSLESQVKKIIQMQEEQLRKEEKDRKVSKIDVAFVKDEVIKEIKRDLPTSINQLFDQPNTSMNGYKMGAKGYGIRYPSDQNTSSQIRANSAQDREYGDNYQNNQIQSNIE